MQNIRNYSQQNIDKSDIVEVGKVLRSKYLTSGPKVVEFEKKIGKYVNSKFSVAVNSATSGLHIACLALGLKKKDIAWTSPISFVASANCALYCGADVDFVDIDKDTFNISTFELEQKLKFAKKLKKLPKVLIVVHLAGAPCDMSKIKELSKKYKFYIIEDASHALGSVYKGSKIGSCKYSDITVFSFHPVKTITTAEGGLVTTNNNSIYRNLTLFREHGIERNKKKFLTSNKTPFSFEQQYLGYNYRLSDVHAALGISQLKRINLFIKKRNAINKYYQKKLSKYSIKFQKNLNNSYSSQHLVIANVDEKKRNLLMMTLLKNGFKTNIHYIPIFFHPFFNKKKYFKNKISKNYYNKAISLPCYYDLSFKQIDKVIKIIKKSL